VGRGKDPEIFGGGSSASEEARKAIRGVPNRAGVSGGRDLGDNPSWRDAFSTRDAFLSQALPDVRGYTARNRGSKCQLNMVTCSISLALAIGTPFPFTLIP
jgi:hypothetical protein